MNEKYVGQKQERTNYFGHFLLLLIFSVYIVTSFVSIPRTKYLIFVLASACTIQIIIFLRDKLSLQDILTGVAIIALTLYYRFITSSGSSSLAFALGIALTGYALGLMIKHKIMSYWMQLVFSYIAVMPFLYALIILAVDLDHSFYEINRNSITLRLVFTMIPYVVYAVYSERKYIQILPIGGVVVASFYSMSRTGLVISFFLFGIVVLYDVLVVIRFSKKEKFNAWKKVLLILTIVLIVISMIVVATDMCHHSRFLTEGLNTTGRIEIYRVFFSSLNWKTIVGIPNFNQGVEMDWHNSFLTMIDYFGIFAFVIFIIIAVGSIALFKKSWALGALLVLWAVYSLPEAVSPYNLGDFLFIPLMMLAFESNKQLQPVFRADCTTCSENVE